METFAHGNHDILLGGVAGLIAYLYDHNVECKEYAKEREGGCEAIKFNLFSLITNIAMGAFVAYVVGTAIADTNEYKTILVGFSGFSAYSILALARSRFAETLLDKIFSKKD